MYLQLAGIAVPDAQDCVAAGSMSEQFGSGVRFAGMAGAMGASLILLYELFGRGAFASTHAERDGSALHLLLKERTQEVQREWSHVIRAVALAAITPLLEKNVTKTLAMDVPIVFSMSRVVVLAFAVGMVRQLWHAGIAGWPDATLAIAVVLALPTLGALERVTPERIVDLTTAVVGRFGVGDARTIAGAHTGDVREPSKVDGLRAD